MSGITPPPQSALHEVAPRHVHSPVVVPGHVTALGLSRTVHVGGAVHEAATVVLNVPPAPVALKRQLRPPTGTVSPGTVWGIPSGHGTGIGPLPQSAVHDVAPRQVHSPVVVPPHATMLGLNRTVHVGGVMHDAVTVVLYVPPGPVAVKRHEAPGALTGKPGAVCSTPSGHMSGITPPPQSALHEVAPRHVHSPVVVPGHETAVGLNRTVHEGASEHVALSVVVNVPPGPVAVNRQDSPGLFTTRSRTVSIIPSRQLSGMGPVPQSALQVVAPTHVQSALVVEPHGTLLGLNRAVHRGGETQRRATHESVPPHASPQPPQCCGSLVTSTHTVAPPTTHRCLGAAQSAVHVPLLHARPIAHARPQAPQ
jgi:hypothetical protein